MLPRELQCTPERSFHRREPARLRQEQILSADTVSDTSAFKELQERRPQAQQEERASFTGKPLRDGNTNAAGRAAHAGASGNAA